MFQINNKTKRDDYQDYVSNKIIINNYNGLLYLPTGVGKSKVIIDALKKSNFKSILWVCATEDSRDKTLPSEFKKWKASKVFKKVDRICWASLKDHNKSYDLYVLDEVQMITSSNVEYFKDKSGCILACTGTIPRDKDKQEILYNRLGLEIIEKLTVDEAVNLELIADYKIKIVYVDIDKKTKLPIKGKNGTFYATEYASYSWYTSKYAELYDVGDYLGAKKMSLSRARFIYNSKTKALSGKQIMNKLSKYRTISFSKSIESAENLSNNPYHSKLNKAQKKLNYDMFNSLKRSVISTVEAANTSLNFIDIEKIFVQQVDSNPGNYLQRMGRGLRMRPGYIAEIIILCLRETQDETWVYECVKDLSQDKINYLTLEQFLNE